MSPSSVSAAVGTGKKKKNRSRSYNIFSIDDLHVGGGKNAGPAPTLADPPAVGLFLVNGDKVAGSETELVVEIGRVLVNGAAALDTVVRLAGDGGDVRRVDVLVIVVLAVAAELVKVAEVLLVGWILRVTVAGCPVRPVALLALAVLRQLQHLELAVGRVLEFERFVLCPRRNLEDYRKCSCFTNS